MITKIKPSCDDNVKKCLELVLMILNLITNPAAVVDKKHCSQHLAMSFLQATTPQVPLLHFTLVTINKGHSRISKAH